VTLLVTGAGGFIGQAVARALARRRDVGPVRLLDRQAPPTPDDPRFSALAADLTDLETVGTALDGIETVIHLASIPGGLAEARPALSRAVNVDAALQLLEALDARARPSRFVFASSIAVFGRLGGRVDDETPPEPQLVYGAHKRMVEIALADFHRRGRVQAVALRLPGVVARPRGDSGLKSAFMSDVFHAAAAGERYTLPVGPEAAFWLMSARCVAENLVHAAGLDRLDGRALTLPALRVEAGALANALFADPRRVAFAPDAALQAGFGAYPPLDTPAADALGFVHDGDLDGLIAAVRADA
jgi:D-erythronate 2-dehydrogenase